MKKLSSWPFLAEFSLEAPSEKLEHIVGWKTESGGGEYLHIREDKGDSGIRLRRDPIGVVPCYYHMGKVLTVSTSLKCIAEHLGFTESNREFVTKVLSEDFSDLQNSQIKNIQRLPPAHELVMRAYDGQANLTVRPYITSLKTEVPTLLESLLPELVSERLKLLPKSCLLFSGGLDSSLIARLADLSQNAILLKRGLLFTKSPEKNPEIAADEVQFYKNLEFITDQEVQADDFWPLGSGLHKYCYYSPGLMLFYTLMKRLPQDEVKHIWTGLGGDDLFSVDLCVLAEVPWSQIAPSHRLKALYYKSPSWLQRLLSSLRERLGFSKISPFTRYRLGPLSQSMGAVEQYLQMRLWHSGRYTYGIEIEQELAQSRGLAMSYPLLDFRLVQGLVSCPASELYSADQESKPYLRKIAEKYLKPKLCQNISEQTYYRYFLEALNAFDRETQFRQKQQINDESCQLSADCRFLFATEHLLKQ